MTTETFKKDYPQYAHLEGDDLWDAMTLSLLDSDRCLTADPNREVVYSEPIIVDILQDDGVYRKMSFSIEDETTTRWLNKFGEEVKVEPTKHSLDTSHTSYKMVILNIGNEE